MMIFLSFFVCLPHVHAKDTISHDSTREEFVGIAKRIFWHGYDYLNVYRHPSCSHDHLGELWCTNVFVFVARFLEVLVVNPFEEKKVTRTCVLNFIST